jgi:hypothetical protein
MDGFPLGRCTAFIGNRGGHKSHLGYTYLIDRINDIREHAIIVSLRDDERMTEKTMSRIIATNFREKVLSLIDSGGNYRDIDGTTPEGIEKASNIFLNELIGKGNLEILYYHPGYITPEEFFHRMYMSLRRIRHETQNNITVLFNSLDQLNSRFPLCAKQEIFIPGIIECLNGEKATSIFIAVNEPGQPTEQYGLLPMADQILSFNPYCFDFADYYGHIRESYGGGWPSPPASYIQTKSVPQTWYQRIIDFADSYGYDAEQQLYKNSQMTNQVIDNKKLSRYDAIVLQMVRLSGGKQSGARGILELVSESKLGLYDRAGLHYSPLNPKYDYGKLNIESFGNW